MSKQELLNELYQGMDLDTFMTYAHFYNVPYKCIIDTPVYELTLNDVDEYNMCSKINEIYKNMTCNNLNSAGLTLNELQETFNKIFVNIKFE